MKRLVIAITTCIIALAGCGSGGDGAGQDADAGDPSVEEDAVDADPDTFADPDPDPDPDTAPLDVVIDFPCEPEMDAGDECETLVGICSSVGEDCYWDPSVCSDPGCSCVFSDVDNATCTQRCFVCACEQLCGPGETCVGITDGYGHPVMIGEHWSGICSWL